MSPRIGPTFGLELATNPPDAGGCAWSADGTLNFPDNASDAYKVFAAAVLAAHDPTKVPQVVPAFEGAQLQAVLTDGEAAALDAYLKGTTPAKRAYWSGMYRFRVPITAPKIIAIAHGAGIDLAGWYARAGAT